MTIRKVSKTRFTMPDPVRGGALSEELAEFLRSLIETGRTLLNVRIMTSEDVRELRIEKPNVLAAECRKDAHESRVDFDDLLKASLSWKPDRTILCEMRGVEARTLLDSFNTGHAGSTATIHASSAMLTLNRFSEPAMRSHQHATTWARRLRKPVRIVIQMQCLKTKRRVTEVILVRIYDQLLKCFAFEPVYDVAHEPNRAATDTIHAAHPRRKGKRREDDGTAERQGFKQGKQALFT